MYVHCKINLESVLQASAFRNNKTDWLNYLYNLFQSFSKLKKCGDYIVVHIVNIIIS
jgi:hypothetical protein